MSFNTKLDHWITLGSITGSGFGRHEIHRCFWPRCRSDEGQKLFDIHSGVHGHYQLCGEFIAYLFPTVDVLTISQRFAGSTLYLLARLITG